MKLVLVDNNAIIMKMYEHVTKRLVDCETICFEVSAKALQWLEANDADTVVVDYHMPTPNGLEFIRSLRQIERHKTVPILMITSDCAKDLRYAALDNGATDFLTKPVDFPEFLARVRNSLALSTIQKQLADTARFFADLVGTAAEQLAARERDTIIGLSRAAERRDATSSMHVVRMAHYSKRLAAAIGVSRSDQDLLLMAAPLHDIGKIGIPDSILLKAAKLSAAEYETMKQHSTIGFEILRDGGSKVLQCAAEIALTHHEKYDGRGYPKGLVRDEIPLFGRICAVSDVFDALTSRRTCRQAWSVDDAIAHIRARRGTHFDPRVVDGFMAVQHDLMAVKSQFPDTPDGKLEPISA